MLKMGITDAVEPCFSIPTVGVEALMKLESSTPTPSPGGSQILHQGPLARRSKLSDNQRHLLGLFLHNFNPYHQFLDPSCPELQVQSLTSGGAISWRPDTKFLSNVIYAVGAHFMEKGEKGLWPKRCASLGENRTTESCSKTTGAASIKGISLMCWVEMMNCNENLAWIYNSVQFNPKCELGLTATIAIATGIILSL